MCQILILKSLALQINDIRSAWDPNQTYSTKYLTSGYTRRGYRGVIAAWTLTETAISMIKNTLGIAEKL